MDKPPIQPSAHQAAVIKWVLEGVGSCIVNAVAGSGKTTLILMCLPSIPERMSVRVLAFNKSIADELNAKIEKMAQDYGHNFRSVRASTFHSLGIGAVAKKLGCETRELRADGGKLRKLVQDWLGDAPRQMYGEYICKLTALAKGVGIGILAPDTDQEWWNLVRHHDLYLDHEDADEGEALSLARELLHRSNKAAEQRIIDFDDMLYLPLLWRLRLWQNDWVVVDEAQDTNPVRRALAKAALRPGGRSMWVGDPRQAIYGFTGASHDAMDIIRREFKAIELPLSVCYRCPKLIQRRVVGIVPQFTVPEAAVEGSEEQLTLDEAAKVMGAHDAIVCRNTAPLISAAYALIAKKKPCVVLGREIGQGLITLIKRMQTQHIDVLEKKLAMFAEREIAKFMSQGEEQKAEAVNDRVECIKVIIDNLPEDGRSVAALIIDIETLFSDTNGRLTLATIHKVKGKEYQRLAVLNPELSPSRWARQDWQHDQEMNLIYVRDTRCREHYITIVDAKPRKKEEVAA